MIINKDVIKSLKPCVDRYENYLEHYANFNGNQDDFFELTKISHTDKLWVILRLVPRELIEVFAIDCAVQARGNFADATAYAAAYATAYAAAYATAYAAAAATDAAAAAATDAAAYAATDAAAYAAAYAAADAAERTRQLDALSYLISIYEV